MKANASRFPSRAITTYPLGIQAVAIVSNIGAGYVIDMTNRRIPMAILASLLQLIVAIMLIVPTLSQTGTFVAFYLSGTSYIVNPIMYGWASIICQRGGDDATRSVILYTMSMSQAILYTFWGIALYPADDAPYWKKGAITMIVVVFTFLGLTAAMEWVSATARDMIPSLITADVLQLDRRSAREDSGDSVHSGNSTRRGPEITEKQD